MKRLAGIVMNAYKAPTFRANLKKAGFLFTEEGEVKKGALKGALIFKVEFEVERLAELKTVVDLSNQASSRMN